MAVKKGKIVYLLSVDSRCRVSCRVMWAELLKWERFAECRVRHIKDLFGGRYEPSLSDDDRPVLLRLAQYGSRGAEAVFSGPDGFTLLRDIVQTKRAYLENGNRCRIHWGGAVEGEPIWEETRDGSLQRTFLTDTEAKGFVATAPVCYINCSGKYDRIGRLKTVWPGDVAASWLGEECTEKAEAIRQQTLFMNRNPALTPPALPGEEQRAGAKALGMVPVLRLMEGTTPMAANAGSLVHLEEITYLNVCFRYGKREVLWDDARQRIAFEENGGVFFCERDPAAEAEVIQQLQEWGFELSAGAADGDLLDLQAGRFYLPGGGDKRWEVMVKSYFRAAEKRGWQVHDGRIGRFNLEREAAVESGMEESASGAFDLSVTLAIGRKKVPLLPLLRAYVAALSKGARGNWALPDHWTLAHVSEREGAYILLPLRQIQLLLENLFELHTEEKLTPKGNLRVPRFRAVELAVSGTVGVPAKLDTGRWGEVMAPGAELKWQPPAQLPPSCDFLRDYQKNALGWLDFLRQTGTSGILADDMGLGKTLMVLAYLAYELARGRLDRPFLIVCPKSVLDNWQHEAKQRFPELHPLLHSGAERGKALPTEWPPGAGVLTSYPLLREDQHLFAAVEWSMVFFDEAQMVKNHRTKTFQAARSLSAGRKVCVTGTPMENHLGEMWALFDLIMPDLLGGYASFERTFRRPAESGAPAVAAASARALARRVAPFILRRKKEEVAAELPPRTEMTHWIEMGDEQVLRYAAVHRRIFNSVSEVIRKRGVAESQLHILDALTRLRLMCCDPRLGQEGLAAEEAGRGAGAEESAKLQYLLALLEELIDEGRRVLVFSQFVRMLELIEPELEQRGWSYLKLTGQSQNRRELVKLFNSGDAPVFLISLKAGGFGLNLTTADSVIHYDPWWNPAVEAQATDRAHRIGQHKPVFVHRLIVKDSIESRILEIHGQKRSVVDSLLSGIPGDRLVLDEETVQWLFGGLLPASVSPAEKGLMAETNGPSVSLA